MTRKSIFNTTQNQYYLESLFFIFLFLFSLIYAKERIINSDAAFYLFNLINYKDFNIEHGRYAAILSQIFTFLAIKMSLSLKTVIYIYSGSFIILFWLVYLLIRKALNNRIAALALIMILTIGVSHSLYRPVSESTQGLIYALILFGILYFEFPFSQERATIVKLLISMGIVVLCYFTHPITIFPILFITGYFIIDRQAWKSYLPWAIIIFVLIVFSIKTVLISGTGYEGDKLHNLDSITGNISNFLNIYPTRYILRRIPNLYLVSALVFISLNIFYLFRKQYLKWLLIDMFVLGFLIIHNLIYFAGGSDIELDKNLMTVNFFLFLPFVADIFYEKRLREWQRQGIMVLLLVFSITMILHPAGIYKQRIKYYEALNASLNRQEGHKFYTEKENIDREKILFDWGVPFESMLISSLDGPEHCNTLYLFDNLENLPDYIENPDLFLYVFFWQRRNIHELNQDYFRLPAEPYHYIPATALSENEN